MRRLLLALSLALLIAIPGCGYHTVGSATHVPASVRTLAVPIFTTRINAYKTEFALTDATIRELNIRTRHRIYNDLTHDADATLTGVVLAQSVAPLTYDSTSGQTSSYLISITASVTLTARDGRVLYKNDNLSFRQQYQSTQDLTSFIQEDSAAVKRLSRDFANALVSDMLESF